MKNKKTMIVLIIVAIALIYGSIWYREFLKCKMTIYSGANVGLELKNLKWFPLPTCGCGAPPGSGCI